MEYNETDITPFRMETSTTFIAKSTPIPTIHQNIVVYNFVMKYVHPWVWMLGMIGNAFVLAVFSENACVSLLLAFYF